MSDAPLTIEPLARFHVEQAVRDALAEDLGRAGDITTDAVIPRRAAVEARFVARKRGVVAGLDFARASFRTLDSDISVEVSKGDGHVIEPGDVIATVSGKARAILTGERVALNYMGHLSGIATMTRKFVDATHGTGVRITCTRKTTPGLRAFEKYAVRCGGGFNHRFGLDDAVMIKDNHIAAGGGISATLQRVKQYVGHTVRVEIEVDTLEQLAEVLDEGADIVLLDNMGPEMLVEAVRMIGGRCVAEASGGVTLENVRSIAETGVDVISIGFLTHSSRTLDIGLDIDPL